MGTNFYTTGDPTCDNPEHTATLHIGKSSGGWKFGFHAIPDLGLTSWEAWRTFLAGRTITDEYGTRLSLAEFTKKVEERWTPEGLDRPICRVSPTPEEIRRGFGPTYTSDPRYFHDPDNYDFCDGNFC